MRMIHTTAGGISWILWVIVFGVLISSPISSQATGPLDGRYAEVSSDTTISSAMTPLISFTINLPTSNFVLVNSDGRIYPVGTNVLTNSWIAIDGNNVTNNAIIDFRNIYTSIGTQHSFNLVGGQTLSPGNHTITLYAQAGAGTFVVGASTNLSVMVKPALQSYIQTTTSDSIEYSFNTNHIAQKETDTGENPTDSVDNGGIKSPAPHTPLLSQQVNVTSGSPVIALGSGRVYWTGSGEGDAMVGIYADGQSQGQGNDQLYSRNQGNDQSQWSITDVYRGAEIQAPVYSQAYFTKLIPGTHTISFDASEFPWGNLNGWTENPVRYKVGSNSKLVVLNGGMTVSGSWSKNNFVDSWRWPQAIGSNQYSGLPPINTWNQYGTKTFTVPIGHNGKILFLAKTRAGCNNTTQQDDTNIFLRIRIDGIERGSLGVQRFLKPYVVSSRTIGASYFSVNEPLAPGTYHTVALYTYVEGAPGAKIYGCAISPDLSLVYFD